VTDIRNLGQEVQAEVLKTVRKGQETVRKGQETVRKGQETVTEAIKTVRTMTPALSDLNLPFASTLPKPEELAGSAYSLAMKVLADQRKLAEGVLHATGQLLPGNGATSAKKAATPGKNGTAKNTARKTGSAGSGT
jgi:hypothetical protein